MAVPDFQTLMLPVLRGYADGVLRPSTEVRTLVGQQLQLTTADLEEMLPSARQTRFANRVAWAHSYLKQAKLIESERRGVFRITARGEAVLQSGVDHVDIAYLTQYPEFQEFRNRTSEQAGDGATAASSMGNVAGASPRAAGSPSLTPDEQIRAGYALQRAGLAAQVLDRVKQASPAFFESLVVRLLVAMGYGGSEEDAARVVGRSGDGGIDGIIKEDRLGFDSIYVQAKRWENTVGRPTIQQFAGALQGHRARKGAVITTASFTRDAVEYAATLQTTIVLIDGEQLADLMIEFGIGVTEVEVVRLKRIDEDYFGEE